MAHYNPLNKAQAGAIIASAPINQNLNLLDNAINTNYDLAVQVETKVGLNQLATANGVATLDSVAKLSVNQVPEIAKGHVYEVDSEYAQLSIAAYPGDICVRRDIGKTYCLNSLPTTNYTMSNWTEISAINAGGEILGNPCYKVGFLATSWTLAESYYTLTYPESLHQQGNSQNIIVEVKDSNGNSVNCNYKVTSNGDITIFSNAIFDGSVMISNLSGNAALNNKLNYSIISGTTDAAGRPQFLSLDDNNLNLVTTEAFKFIDGFGTYHSITNSNPTALAGLVEGVTYIIFVDSANINDETLSYLTVLPYGYYHGVVTEFPNNAEVRSRCYIAYDKSYEYQVGGTWGSKAFLPIGQFDFKSGIIDNLYCYPFNQNNTIAGINSHVTDYLFGNKIEGLEVNITDATITVSPGKCLSTNNHLMILSNAITKNMTSPWRSGSNTSGIDSMTSEDTGWGDIYLIANDYDVDVYLTYGDINLPTGYFYYRKIGCFYSYFDSTVRIILPIEQFNDTFYFNATSSMITTETLVGDDTVNNCTLDVPTNCKEVVLNYEMTTTSNIQTLTFYSAATDGIILNKSYGYGNTVNLPTNGNVYYTATTADDITITPLGIKLSR